MSPESLPPLDPVVAASRPEPDMAIAREVREIVEHMLGDGRSTLEPDTYIWRTETARALQSRMEQHPSDNAGRGQWDKLDEQLRGAPREVVLLAAEIAFLREHPVRSALPGTRREHLERILRHLDREVTIPEPISGCLDRPSNVAGFNPGQGYHGSLWKHIAWVTSFIGHWAGLPEPARYAQAGDPWRVQHHMLECGPDRPDIRNALQFLAFPEAFEPISSATMKEKIRDGLADRIGGGTGDGPAAVDHDLLAIRSQLATEINGPFHFWSLGVAELWQGQDAQQARDEAETDALEPRPIRYWLYSPGQQAREWGEFAREGIMAIGWEDVGDLRSYPDRASMRAALDAAKPGTTHTNDALGLWQFQHEIAVGDVIFAKRGRRELVGRGVVTSTARYEADRDDYRYVRSVQWTHQGSWPLARDAILKTLTDITADRESVDQYEALITGESEEVAAPAARPAPPYDKQSFLTEVYLTESQYDRLRSLVLRKKNIILAGPPGVGKTFAAKRLAYSIIGEKDPSRVEMVQFHQSYSYEDFMMGYRPTESGGFVLSEGPFYRFCEVARADDESRPYFFVIDEINRGNISKIFGELLMLIEADKRGQELRLLYKNETFSIPKNLHVIGMMNTADRSLAVLDYALRRRFGFFSMRPALQSEGFTTWQREIGSPSLDRLVSVLIAVNEQIAADPALGRGFEIGHSFLATAEDVAVDQAWLASVVDEELVPLLEEYWFDEEAKVDEWSAKLRAAVQ